MSALIGLVPPLFFALIWLALMVFLRLRRGVGWTYLALFAVFGVYLYAVLTYTLIQFQSLLVLRYFEPNLIIRGVDAGQAINLIPLVTLTTGDVKTSLLNVLLFLPFGVGLPFITDFRFGKVVVAGALFSLAIELMQLLTGYLANTTFRVADVNDVLFNTVGAALGYVLFVALVRLSRRALGDWRNTPNPLLRYIIGRPQVGAPRA